MPVTNLTNLSSSGNFHQVALFDNQVTNGIFGIMFFITLYVILTVLAMKRYEDEFEKALLASSFIVFCISITLAAIQLLNFNFVISTGVIFVIVGFFTYLTRRR